MINLRPVYNRGSGATAAAQPSFVGAPGMDPIEPDTREPMGRYRTLLKNLLCDHVVSPFLHKSYCFENMNSNKELVSVKVLLTL